MGDVIPALLRARALVSVAVASLVAACMPPSWGVFAALAGPKKLTIVEGAGHNDALGKVWPEVEGWIAEVTAGRR